MPLSFEAKSVNVAKYLSIWRRSKRPILIIDVKMYEEYFPFLRPVHTLLDKSYRPPKITSFCFHREEALRLIEEKYDLKRAEEANGYIHRAIRGQQEQLD